MHGLWSGISRIFTPLSKEFYVRSAHSRAALTPQTGSMTPLNLLPQRFDSKPQAEWLLHGAAVSLSRSEAVSWESQDFKNEKLTLLLTRVIVFVKPLTFLSCATLRTICYAVDFSFLRTITPCGPLTKLDVCD